VPSSDPRRRAYLIREAERRAEFPSGGVIQIKSAHAEAALRGEGLDRVILDEAAFMREEAWSTELRPALADKQGDAFFISTFDGDTDWFFDIYERGLDPAYPEWQSWRFPTSANPSFSEEIEQARREMTKEEFEQKFEASPISYRGAVFKGALLQQAIDRTAGLEYDERLPSYAGVD
jgi:hypothetical protein